jgi:hypothetical protein
MRLLLCFALAAAIAVGCSKPADSSSTSGGTTGAAPNGQPPASASTTGTPAAATGKYAAVQTIFTTNCVKCHSGARPKAGIDLSSYDTLMKGGREGAVIKPGDAAGSKLVMALHGQGAKQMPPPGPLAPADVATVEAWVKDGAKNG